VHGRSSCVTRRRAFWCCARSAGHSRSWSIRSRPVSKGRKAIPVRQGLAAPPIPPGPTRQVIDANGKEVGSLVSLSDSGEARGVLTEMTLPDRTQPEAVEVLSIHPSGFTRPSSVAVLVYVDTSSPGPQYLLLGGSDLLPRWCPLPDQLPYVVLRPIK
jgi:hypothetical protein